MDIFDLLNYAPATGWSINKWTILTAPIFYPGDIFTIRFHLTEYTHWQITTATSVRQGIIWMGVGVSGIGSRRNIRKSLAYIRIELFRKFGLNRRKLSQSPSPNLGLCLGLGFCWTDSFNVRFFNPLSRSPSDRSGFASRSCLPLTYSGGTAPPNWARFVEGSWNAQKKRQIPFDSWWCADSKNVIFIKIGRWPFSKIALLCLTRYLFL